MSRVRTRVQKVKPKMEEIEGAIRRLSLRGLKAVNSPAIVDKTTKLNISLLDS